MQYAFAPEIIDARLISNLVVALSICVCFCMAIKFAIARKIKQHMQWIYYATSACLAVITPLFFDIFMLLINTLVSDTYEGISLMLTDYGRLTALMIILVLAHWFYSKQHAK